MKERKIIYRIRVGSQLYGLSTPESDEDFLSVFLPSDEDLLGLNKVDMINNSTKSSSEDRRNTKDDIDDVSYSLPKFMHLLLGNNPNIVETLFATGENVLICEPEFQPLIDNYKKLISQKIYFSFTSYAYSQKKKLITKKERYASLTNGIKLVENRFTKDQLTDRKYGLTQDDADWMNKNLDFYKNRDGNAESFHIGLPLHVNYEKLVSERDNYGWRVKTDTFLSHGYDLKFGMHSIRIMAEGLMLLETSKLEFPFTGEHKINVMRIRNGDVYLDELLEMHETYAKLCEKALETTVLPKKPNFKWANNYLVNILRNNIIKDVV